MKKSAFTLIELSIVLVIIGLIVGGVLVGRDLIKAAELRSVITQQERFKTAVNTFMGKYNALPGDMINATSIWGAQDPTPATCIATASTSTLTCNGNGDGQIDYEYTTTNPWESFRAWQHISNAGLIEGRYDGIPHDATTVYYLPGINVPGAKLANGVWGLWYLQGRYSSSWWEWAPEAPGHYLALGSNVGSVAQRWHNPLLKPEHAMSIDQKIDDGKPYTGNVNDIGGVTNNPDCTTNETASASYNISNKTIACLSLFRVF